MTPIITYSLRREARNSDDYYRAIARLADEWTASAVPAVKEVIEGFRAFRRQGGHGDRSGPEYAFELLALGVLLHEHGGEARHLPGMLARALSWLVSLQERWPQMERVIKVVRGGLAQVGRRWRVHRAPDERMSHLLAWLRANGEGARAERLAQWQAHFERAGQAATRHIIARCLGLADEFAVASAHALGPYTERVDQFVFEVAPKYRWRYDAELLARTRLEYHLGMLGTEILSRAYRERFLAAKRKVVIVPPCMRAQPEEKCRAIQTPLGARCQHCTPTCRVHQFTRLGEKRGFEVYMIPDELRGLGAEAGRAVEGLGLVGVSCALTNWSGGWEADALGVPAQGLLLDYVGCAYHWDEEGIPTDANMRQLEETLGLRSRVLRAESKARG